MAKRRKARRSPALDTAESQVLVQAAEGNSSNDRETRRMITETARTSNVNFAAGEAFNPAAALRRVRRMITELARTSNANFPADEAFNPTCRCPGSADDLRHIGIMKRRQVHRERYLACLKPVHPVDTRAKLRSWTDEVSQGGVWADVKAPPPPLSSIDSPGAASTDAPAIAELPPPLSSSVSPSAAFTDAPAIAELPPPLSSIVSPGAAFEEPEPAACSTLLVSNIPKGITVAEVRTLFGGIGRLTDMKVIPGITSMVATVTFEKFADAQCYRENAHGGNSGGVYGAIKVRYANPAAQEERCQRYRSQVPTLASQRCRAPKYFEIEFMNNT